MCLSTALIKRARVITAADVGNVSLLHLRALHSLNICVAACRMLFLQAQLQGPAAQAGVVPAAHTGLPGGAVGAATAQ